MEYNLVLGKLTDSGSLHRPRNFGAMRRHVTRAGRQTERSMISENRSYCERPYQLNLTHLSAQRNRKRTALAKAANERSPVTEPGV